MSIQDQIKEQISSHKVVLYMKGNPTFPQCGFSAKVVQILSDMNCEYFSVNVLDDPEIRQGIKDFAQWPTIPQLYIKGEFIGGCDIVTDLYESGELQSMVGSH